jgi:hypothetical protein
VKGALVGRPVPEEDDHHLTCAAHLHRERSAGADRNAATGDAVGAEVADGEVGHVLRPALATAVTGGLAEQLRHQPVRVAAFGEEVPMAAVGADDQIVRLQRQASADGNRFLPNVRVRGPADAAVTDQLEHALFKGARQRELIEDPPSFGRAQ